MARTHRRRRRVVTLALAVALLVPLSWSAAAEAIGCTITWTGAGGNGQWGNAANWSTSSVPTSSDEACLPTGASVTINSGSRSVGSIQGPHAILWLTGGSLAVTDGETDSHLGTLNFWYSSLSGAGTIRVADQFYYGAYANLSGSGDMILGADSFNYVSFGYSGHGTLDGRHLVNHGVARWYPGALHTRNDAEIENASDGTIDIITDGSIIEVADSSSPTLLNSGTIEKTASSSTATIEIATNNPGTVAASVGKLEFSSGSSGTSVDGAWSASGSGSIALTDGTFTLDGTTSLAGDIHFDGADITTDDIQGPDAVLWLTDGSLAVTDGGTDSHLGTLNFWYSSLSGAGTIRVADQFYYGAHADLSGSGDMILGADSINHVSFGPGDYGTLDGRHLVHRGTATWYSGELDGKNGAKLTNDRNATITSSSLASQ